MGETVSIIGDIGGHLGVFERALVDAGVDVPRALVPDSVTIVQVGDLVHKGPHSDQVVELADRLIRNNPGRYIQLLGNHEAHYLGGPNVTGRKGVVEVSDRTSRTLRRWSTSQSAALATAVTTVEHGEVLITHSGLTAGLWRDLGSPLSPHAAAAQINALMSDPDEAFRPGWLMTGTVDHHAGVTCSRTGAELAASWIARGDMPFTQIHGHEGVWWWPSSSWHDDVPAEVKALSFVDEQHRTCGVRIQGELLLSVDWVLGEVPPEKRWRPLTLQRKFSPGLTPW